MSTPSQAIDTMPVRQLGTASEVLDANSSATTIDRPDTRLFSPYVRDWISQSRRTVEIASMVTPVSGMTYESLFPTEAGTMLQDILLPTEVKDDAASPPGVFIVARPVRKKLFEMQFKLSHGGLPRRKPFVWIPDRVSED